MITIVYAIIAIWLLKAAIEIIIALTKISWGLLNGFTAMMCYGIASLLDGVCWLWEQAKR